MSDSKSAKMRPLLFFEACWHCGQEGYATRTQPIPEDQPYYCEECEIWQKVEESQKEREKEFTERINTLEEAIMTGFSRRFLFKMQLEVYKKAKSEILQCLDGDKPSEAKIAFIKNALNKAETYEMVLEKA